MYIVQSALYLCIGAAYSKCIIRTLTYIVENAWCRIGRVDAFRPEGRESESRSSRHVGDLGQVFYTQLPVALRLETPTQYPCCVGNDLSSSGLEEARQK